MPALSFAVMGFASAYYFLHSKRYKWLIAAAVFYAIAGLFKVTALLSLVALVGALGLSYLIKVRELNWRELVPLVLEVIPSFLWIAYAKYYNEDHLCYYFSTQLYPIWELDFNGIVYHLDLIHKAWAGQFYPTITLVILACSLVTILFLIRRYSLVVKLWLLLVLIGVLAYIAMQFQVLFAHDYYFTNLFILPLMVMSFSFVELSKSINQRISSIAGVVLSLILFLAFQKGDKINAQRREQFKDAKPKLIELRPLLDRLGVSTEDKIVFTPDESNVSLYYLRRKGWTQYGYPLNENGSMKDSKTYTFRLKTMYERGNAKYVVIYGDEALTLYPEIVPFLGEELGDSLGLRVYQFKPQD